MTTGGGKFKGFGRKLFGFLGRKIGEVADKFKFLVLFSKLFIILETLIEPVFGDSGTKLDLFIFRRLGPLFRLF